MLPMQPLAISHYSIVNSLGAGSQAIFDALQVEIHRLRRPARRPLSAAELIAGRDEQRQQRAPPAAQIEQRAAIGQQAALQQRKKNRVETQLVARKPPVKDIRAGIKSLRRIQQRFMLRAHRGRHPAG